MSDDKEVKAEKPDARAERADRLARSAPSSLARVSAQSTSPTVHLERVTEFLLAQTHPDRTQKLRCTFFALHHLSLDDGGQHPITTDEVATRVTDRTARCEEVAAKFLDAADAEVFSNTGGRAQKFRVCSYTTTSLEAYPLASVTFTLESRAPMGNGLGESEGPNVVGMTSQSMRQTEAFARMFASANEKTQERLERMLDRANETIENLQAHNSKLVLEREQLLSLRLERELAHRKGHLSIEREERLVRMLEVFGAQWIGKKLGQPAAHPLVKVFASLSHEQQLGMAALMTPEQREELADVIQSLSAASGQASAREVEQVSARGRQNGAG